MEPSGLQKTPFDPGGPVKVLFILWQQNADSHLTCSGQLPEALQIETLGLFTLVFLTSNHLP